MVIYMLSHLMSKRLCVCVCVVTVVTAATIIITSAVITII